ALAAPTPIAGFLTPVSSSFVTPPTPVLLLHAITAAEATATVAAARQQADARSPAAVALQDDFRVWATTLDSIYHSCATAEQAALQTLQGVKAGSATVAQADHAIGAARDTCATAKASFAALTIPPRLSGFHLDETRFLVSSWAAVVSIYLEDLH